MLFKMENSMVLKELKRSVLMCNKNGSVGGKGVVKVKSVKYGSFFLNSILLKNNTLAISFLLHVLTLYSVFQLIEITKIL